MIKIEKPREKNCYCRCCQSADNVLEVQFNSETGGTHVALCENCREELADKLIKCDRKNDDQEEKERGSWISVNDEYMCSVCEKIVKNKIEKCPRCSSVMGGDNK